MCSLFFKRNISWLQPEVWKVLLNPNCNILSFHFLVLHNAFFNELTSLDHSVMINVPHLAWSCWHGNLICLFFHLLFPSQVLDCIPTALKLDVKNFDLKNETESGFFLSYLMEWCVNLVKQWWPVLVLHCTSILLCSNNSLWRGGLENNQILISCCRAKVSKIFCNLISSNNNIESQRYACTYQNNLRKNVSSVHKSIPYLFFPSVLLQISDRICVVVMRYGIRVRRLAVASIPIITEENPLPCSFLAWMDRFVSERHAAPPAQGLPAIQQIDGGNGESPTQSLQHGNVF